MKKTIRPPGGFSWEGRPGFFTELMHANAWPPGFVPTSLRPGELDNFNRSRIAAAARDVQLAHGFTGSIKGISKKADARLQQTADAAIAKARRK
jgi:hypothetical protein